MISVPSREDLESRLIVCPSCRSRFNPDYHMRTYDENALGNLLTEHGFNCTRLHHLGESLELVGLSRWHLVARNWREGSNPFAAPIPCPMCGFMLPSSSTTAKTVAEWGGRRFDLRGRLKQIWPKRIRPAWLLAVYERWDRFRTSGS